MSLANLHQRLDSKDRELLEKQAAEEYQRGEEMAAGKIMARGFYDELSKLAEWGMPTPSTIPSKPLSTGGGNTGANAGASMGGGRKASAPPAPPPPQGSVTGGKGATMKDAKGQTFNTSTSTKPSAKPPGIGGPR